MKQALICVALAAFSGVYADDPVKTPTKKELISTISHAWISEEVLVWETTAKRFAYANKAHPIGSASYVDPVLNKPHSQWNPGVRINGGYQFEHWTVFATWTYLQNQATGHKSTDGFHGFFPVLSMAPGLTPQDYVTAASEGWRLNFNSAEVGVSYPWKPRLGLTVKPHAAVRLAFVDQRSLTEYGGGIFSNGIDRLVLKNNFWGIGPAVGVMPAMHLPQGFSLVGDVMASFLGGRLFTKQHESYLSRSLFSHRGYSPRFFWGFDAKVGLNWETEPLYKALALSLQTGWEWHVFYDQTRIQQNQQGFFHTPQNLVMQGAYLSAALGF